MDHISAAASYWWLGSETTSRAVPSGILDVVDIHTMIQFLGRIIEAVIVMVSLTTARMCTCRNGIDPTADHWRFSGRILSSST